MIRHSYVVAAIGVMLWMSSSGAGAQEPVGHYAGESGLRLSIGGFGPAGESDYWQEKEIDFTGSTSGFDDVTGTVDFVHYVSARVGLIGSVGGWKGEQTQSYRDFVDSSGLEISHLTEVDQAWIDFGLLVHLFARRAVIMPYLGGGGSYVSWELVEEGEFIDFSTPAAEIFPAAFTAEGDGFGYFVVAGLEIPIGRHVSLFGEARWR